MQGSDVEAAIRIIAENVVSAFEYNDGAGTFLAAGRDTAVAGLMRELLGVMPTDDSDVLAAACNRVLDSPATMSMPGPRVEAVGPYEGAVTMRRTRATTRMRGRGPPPYEIPGHCTYRP
ncbi:hypothetical protein ACRAWG_20880 [Methylobacterium sp. P31]